MGGAGLVGGEGERLAFALLRQGDLVGAITAAEAVPAAERTPSLAMTAADARVCSGQGDLDEIEHLRDIAATTGDKALGLRVQAALADYHALRGNPLCGQVAAQALAAVGDDGLLDTERHWARGRLWRTLALSLLFVPQDRPATSLDLLERAKADFSAAGFDAESARATADLHFVWTLAFAEDIDRTSDIVTECLARMRTLGTSYTGLLLAYRLYLDFFTGDLPAAHAGLIELDRLAADDRAPLLPLARVISGYVRVAVRLMGDGPTRPVLDAIEAHFETVRSEAMLVTTGQLVGIAAVLIDLGYVCPGHLAVARRWASQAAAGEASTPQTGQDLAGLNARLDLLERADDAAVAAVDADIAAVRNVGLRRDAGHRALRGALAARRAGRHDDAERLERQAVADLPAVAQRIFWEHAILNLLRDLARRAQPRRGGPEVRLLGPEVTVTVAGRTHAVRPTIARLLVALVAEGGSAPADRLVDFLWPDADAATGRARLRVALHRLRRALGGERDSADDPVERRGDLVGLASTVTVDALEFERLARGGPLDRAAALDLYRGGVAEVQLAYDDVALPLRRRLDGRWRRIARRALDDVGLAPETAARIAAVAVATAAATATPDDPDGDHELIELARAAEAHLAGARA